MRRFVASVSIVALLVGCVDVVQTLPTASPGQPPIATRGPGATPGPISPTAPPVTTLPPSTTLPPVTTPAPGDTPGPVVTPGPVIPPGPGPVTADNARMVAATVQIVRHEEGPGGVAPVGAGSGTIISPDGLIVTNAHVAAPDAPGLAVQYGDLGGSAPAAQLEIRLTEQEDRPPVARYIAEVVAVDGYLDIAVVRITTTLDGQPATNLDLPWLEVGDSDALSIGDPITVVGFPGIGGDTVSADQGEVSGFSDDAKIGTRGWIKTSAVVHRGNSGGLAANAQGQLVAVPTRAPEFGNPEDVGGFQLLRPINLARALIDAAMQGVQYGPSPYFVAGSGQEQVQLVGWVQPEATGCAQSDLVSGYPSGATVLRAAVNYSGFTTGLDVLTRWIYQDPRTEQTELVFERASVWEREESGECLIFTLSSRSPFADGTYGFGMGVGPLLRLIGQAQVVVGGVPGPGPGPGEGEGVLLSGSVVDTATGRGIAGANVYVLAPGEDVQAFLAGEQARAVALATTDAEGNFTLNNRIAASSEFPLVITARDYRPWAGTLRTGTRDGSMGEILLTSAAP